MTAAYALNKPVFPCTAIYASILQFVLATSVELTQNFTVIQKGVFSIIQKIT
ncbi:MAG: hypothetical protein QG552_2229 [Thermodesulfobacteriota bacterium]|nr:hypothetical protein [Thermodesulfobacteriota bacterium]